MKATRGNQRYLYQGVTDSVTECDCCGKVDLKRTVVLLDTQLNDFKYFGTTCARKAGNWTVEEYQNEKDDFKAVQVVEDFDKQLESAVGYSRAVVALKALKKGYDKDQLFKKYGKLLETTPWEFVYSVEHLTHRVKK